MTKTVQSAMEVWRCAWARWVSALAFALTLGLSMSTLTVTPAHAQACDPTRQSCGPAQPPPCQRFGTCPTNPPGGGGTCTAPPGGDPAACGGSGPAALPRDSGPSAGAGNPINLLNGNKYQEETDLAPLPGVLGLELKRYYNSQSSHPGMLGSNWRMSYETVLYDFGSQIQIVQADGRRLMFQRGVGANATLCSSSAPQDGQVRIELPKDGKGQPTYFWRWADGRTLMFASGSGGGFPLQSITAATGERVTLSYSPAGELTSIRDPQGRTLSFIYANAAERRSRALKAIDTPLGRLAYTQDASGRLTEVSQAKDASGPPDRTRIYHYEDRYNAGFKQALTGISLRGPDPQTKQPTEQRLSTYAYDATGLAVLSTKGSPLVLKDGKPVADTGIDQVQVAYVDKALPRPVKVDAATGEVTPSQRGQVVLTNSLGQRTQVWSAVIAGHFRLMEMRGAGCSTCGPANMRYGYDAQGALVRSTGLDAQGQPLRSEVVQHDAFGRVTRTGIQTYDGAKPQPVRWMQRFEYADVRFKDGSVAIAPQPSLIARPSVVAGKEHTITFDYNAAGQLTQVTEAGFSPVDANGATAAQGAPISRSTRLAYQVVNGRSVLASVDGPLPNGPKGSPEDSDIVRLSWDNTGTNVVAVVYPMNLTASLEFDEVTGAALKITGPSGYTDSYRYGTDRELLTSTRSRGDQVFGGASYRYDLRGRLLETSSLIGGKPRPETLQAFDVAGRLLWQADRLGVVRKATYDTEGHLVRSQVVGGGIQQEERYAYDASGRVDRVDDNTGATRRLVRDANGRITATIDPLGRATEYAPRPNERSLEVTQAANTSKPLTVRYGIDAAGGVNEIGATASDGGNGKRTVVTRLLKDDFGHEVGIVSPDSGTVFKRYDAADQLIQVRDATGTVVDMAYDAAGRLTARSVTPAAAAGRPPAEAQTTRYRYQGTLLVEIQNPQQTEHYTYDERARVTSRAVRMTLASGQVSSSEERYRYDADGRLVARSLPDGGELQYERNGQGQVVAMSRQTSAWAPFGWGRTTLVSGIEADLIGLRSATYGNGVVAQWQRSREGVLARVVYTSPLRTQSAVRTAFESLMSQAHAQAAAVAQAESAGKPPTPQQLPGAFGLARAPQALWDGRLLYDMAGNVLVQSQFADTAAASPTQTSYTYDGLNQLAQAVRASTTEIDARAVADRAPQSPSGTAWRYHNDSLGNRLLAQQEEPAAEMGRTTKLSYAEPASDRLDEMAMDAAGRPSADGERRYAWDAEGRLAAVSQPGKPTAHYRYDARGLRVSKQIGDDSTHYLYDERRQRVAELDAQGRVQREYVWMGTQLLAVLDLDTPRTAGAAPSDMLGRIAQLAANTWRAWTGHADTLAYVHANHLGAPVAMTDADAKPVWAVEYAPFGQRMSPAAPTLIKVSAPGHAAVAGIEGMRLDLRLPGQWEDAETGLYYNDHRYYDPRAGRYLNPDPSGLNGGLNAYAYVGNNPLGFADPLGLVLFAFDGTGNDESNPSTVSNVVKFKNNYTDGPVYYITGPGTLDPATGIQGGLLDAASSLTGKARITAMINYLNTYSNSVADDTPFNIDIVGFSRGAAEARDFANQVAALFSNGYYRYKDSNGTVKCQKIALNFMGLWDTVLSVHTGSYQLGIPAGFHYVAQATALNEYRPLFPSESILGAATPTGTTRIELGFLGSHADIGGGFGDGDGALSNVSLAWMFQQAKLAMVNVNPPSLSLIANPVIHDKSSNLLNGAPNGGPTPTSQDRDVRYANGTVVKQRQTTDQGMTYNDTTQFINYKSDPNSIDNISGTVNAAKYVEWLTSHGYDLGNLTVH